MAARHEGSIEGRSQHPGQVCNTSKDGGCGIFGVNKFQRLGLRACA